MLLVNLFLWIPNCWSQERLFSITDDFASTCHWNGDQCEWSSDEAWVCLGFETEQHKKQFLRFFSTQILSLKDCAKLFRSSFGNESVGIALNVADLSYALIGTASIETEVDPSTLRRMNTLVDGAEKLFSIPVNLKIDFIDQRSRVLVSRNKVFHQDLAIKGRGFLECPSLQDHVESCECFGSLVFYHLGEPRYRYIRWKLFLNPRKPDSEVIRDDFPLSECSCDALKARSGDNNPTLDEKNLIRLTVTNCWAVALANRAALSICPGNYSLRSDDEHNRRGLPVQSNQQGQKEGCNSHISFVWQQVRMLSANELGYRPDMICQTSFHRGRDAARLMYAIEVIPRRIQRHGSLQVFELLADAVGERLSLVQQDRIKRLPDAGALRPRG